MIITLLSIALILYLALQLSDKLRVPSPLGLIALAFAFNFLFPDAVTLMADPEHFAALVILLLPILLISDSLEIRLDDLKEHGFSLFYLAVVAVALSVVVAVMTADWLFGDYALSATAVVLLFGMVLATDPVSVVSIFSAFQLPHRLKILCEGESLFNDATALIVFVFIGLYALEGGEVTPGYVIEISLAVIVGSALLGGLFGYLGLVLLKTTSNRIAELMVIIIIGYGAFEVAEHFYTLLNLFGAHSHMHLSGILACIVATMTVHHVMSQTVDHDELQLQQDEAELLKESVQADTSRRLIDLALERIKATVEERDRHLRSKEDVQLLALVANTVLFIAMAEIIDIDLLFKYKTEILMMFLATTVIRALMMAKFAIITNSTTHMTNINFRWWGVLTFAGIKGGLSIVMLMMIPPSFPHLEMFQAVVIGVILLSTFVYSAVLLWLIGRNKEVFLKEMLEEEHH